MVDMKLTSRGQEALLAGVARTQGDGQPDRGVVVVVLLVVLQVGRPRRWSS